MPQSTGPTILVKKPDGTKVRMTLAELRSARGASKPSSTKQKTAVLAKKKPSLQAKQTVKEVKKNRQAAPKPEKAQMMPVVPKAAQGKKVKKTPVKTLLQSKKAGEQQVSTKAKQERPKKKQAPIVVEQPPQQTQKPEKAPEVKSTPKHVPLLEEVMEDHELLDTSLHDATTHDEIVDEIMKEFPVRVQPELQMRMRSLIVSLLRGMRDKFAVHEYAVRPVRNAGLGFSDEDAARLVLVVEEKKEAYEKAHKKVLRKKTPSKRVPKKPVEHTVAVKRSEQLAVDTPVVDVFVDSAHAIAEEAKKQKAYETFFEQKSEEDIKEQKPQPKPPAKPVRHAEDTKKVLKSKPARPALHDAHVADPEYRTMGPVDEMKSFSLKDFRRLAREPKRAGERLIQKFDGWKRDSYMLYLETREAWFHSPLYQQYERALFDAINNKTRIEDYFLSSNAAETLRMEEFRALIALNTHLHL